MENKQRIPQEKPRAGNWQLKKQVFGGMTFWRCYRRKNVCPTDCARDRIYDKDMFSSKQKAAERCRDLNAKLVSGWMSDGHPQNW